MNRAERRRALHPQRVPGKTYIKKQQPHADARRGEERPVLIVGKVMLPPAGSTPLRKLRRSKKAREGAQNAAHAIREHYIVRP